MTKNLLDRQGALLARLRAATRPLHERLDLLAGAGLLRSREEYARFLWRSLACVRPLEPALERLLGAEFAPSRAALLERDLAALGLGGPRAGDEDAQDGAAPGSVAAALGAAYVIEGSALGGQVLARRVRAALGDGAPVGYLEHRGGATAARWRWFLGRLEQFAETADEAAVAGVCEGAVAVFHRYLKAFE